MVSALTIVRTMVPRWVNVPKSEPALRARAANGAEARAFWLLLILLLIGTALRRTAAESLQIFFSKYQQDLGMTPSLYGLITSLYMITTAVGGVLGSFIADRIGLRRTLAGTIILTAILLYGFVRTDGLASHAFYALSGLFMGPSHTLFMVAGQRQFPQRMAMVTGVFLGFSFVSGAVGAWLVGIAADSVGLYTMFATFPWMMIASAALAYLALPRRAQQQVVQQEPSATA